MFALTLAYRFLREGLTQTLLIVLGVTVGVAAFVFVSSIMRGLEQNIIDSTLGTQPHVIVSRQDERPRPLMEGDGLYARRVEPSEVRRRRFGQWRRALRRVESTDGVVAACPRVIGPAIAQRSARQEGVTIIGAEAARLSDFVSLPERMVAGAYRLGGEDVLLGDSLAESLGVGVGDRIRLVGSDRRDATLQVAGVYDLGSVTADSAWALVSLRTAQTLLDEVGTVTDIAVQVADPFDAELVSARMGLDASVEVETWMDRNQELLAALRSQAASSGMIQLFVLLAVAMGIASSLVVNVVQKQGQIGILRAVGTPRRTVLAVFLWQGALLGGAGAILGIALGALAAAGLQPVVRFSITVQPDLVGTASIISLVTGLVAALLPARRASRMDPAQAIRGDA